MFRIFLKMFYLFVFSLYSTLSFGANNEQKLLVHGDVPSVIIEWVKGFRGEKVTLDKQVLTFVFKDEKVSDLMANTVASSICMSRFTGDPKAKWPQSTLNKIIVLNKSQTRGFQYNIDAKSCDKYGKMNDDDFKKSIIKTMSEI
ncbi:hypothetical protein [Citrobacter sp. C1]|uniref:hypothetical protein n=1 Tax=Citrobacter sp. C1 TaxID=2769343 RepID=UPI0016602721|nr:hypothetical protein [Citrobacter sp. C1]MBD0830336.1 hypothetical protein [Citrobacter sp. C1]